jgi:Raf kinase inhibitor-like YbhB/YbcL family protein
MRLMIATTPDISGLVARVGWTLTTMAFGVLASAGPAVQNQTGPEKEKPTMNLQLTSSAFVEGKEIPRQYTCQGKDVSPPLKWSGVPTGAKSLVLIADDPDAPMGTWVHWVLFDLPPATTDLSEDMPKTQHLPGGAKQGLNDFKRLGYGGPCPPPGKPHRYFFKLFALDALLDLKPGATKKDVEAAMKGHVLAEGQLMGTYQRK